MHPTFLYPISTFGKRAAERGKKWSERHGLIIRLGKALTWNAVLDKGVGRGWRKKERFWRKLAKALAKNYVVENNIEKISFSVCFATLARQTKQ